MTTQTKPSYRIKSLKGDLIVVTEGMQLMSSLSKKSDLIEALQSSLAHKWLLQQAIKIKPNLTLNVPSTNTVTFKTKAFYQAVKLVVENLREIDELSIHDAIESGNSLIKGQKVITNSFVIHEQIRDALRYRTLAGIN